MMQGLRLAGMVSLSSESYRAYFLSVSGPMQESESQYRKHAIPLDSRKEGFLHILGSNWQKAWPKRPHHYCSKWIGEILYPFLEVHSSNRKL